MRTVSVMALALVATIAMAFTQSAVVEAQPHKHKPTVEETLKYTIWEEYVEAATKEVGACRASGGERCDGFIYGALAKIYRLDEFDLRSSRGKVFFPHQRSRITELVDFLRYSLDWRALGTATERETLTKVAEEALNGRPLVAVREAGARGISLEVAIVLPGPLQPSRRWSGVSPLAAYFSSNNHGRAFFCRSLAHAWGLNTPITFYGYYPKTPKAS